jgi:RNA polymerase sigma-70 factor (ECF subfamily)
MPDPSEPAAGAPSAEDLGLVAALRAGDEQAFTALVERYHAPMLRLARSIVPTAAGASDAVQDAWLGVLQGLDRFEGRSSLKTWIFRILTNVARTRAVREGRTLPFSSIAAAEVALAESALEPDRFLPLDDPEWPHYWSSYPNRWDDIPEARLLSAETFDVIKHAIRALPPAQAAVITLRDVEGWPPDQVCNVLEVSETNHRVLLHRARSKVRRALEQYFDEGREA